MNNDTYAERIRGLEELLVEATVNMVERRSLDGDIFKLAEDHKQLLAENDDLRAQLLQAPDAKLVAFVAAFELRLEGKSKTSKERYLFDGESEYDRGWWRAMQEALAMHEQLKAQHLGDDSKTS